MSRRMLHVRILGTHRLVRSYLHALLKDDKTIRVLQTDESAADRASSSPLVLLIDGGNCEKPLVRTVQDLKSRFPAAKMVVLSAAPPYADLILLLSLGVTGLLTYDQVESRLLATIHSVSEGHLCVDPDFFAHVAPNSAQGQGSQGRVGQPLTQREKQILQCLEKGLVNKEIANLYGISVGTVKFHLGNIYEKLGVHSRLEILAAALDKAHPPAEQPAAAEKAMPPAERAAAAATAGKGPSGVNDTKARGKP
jgi:DNA-binding NarL/FixJ family response regulator